MAYDPSKLSKRAQLIISLLNNTRNRTVTWSDTSIDDVFQTSFPLYSLQITFLTRFSPNIAEPITDYVIRIYNREGVIIEEFTDVTLSAENPLIEARTLFGWMEELFAGAKAAGLGSEKAIVDILNYLEDAEIPF